MGDTIATNYPADGVGMKSNDLNAAFSMTNPLRGRATTLDLESALCTPRTDITSLSMSGSRQGDGAADSLARILKRNKCIRKLYCAHTGIGSRGACVVANALAYNNTLTVLDLWDNEIGPKGAASLAATLCVNSTLTALNLWGNPVLDCGAVALATALEGGGSLRSLSLWSCGVGVIGATALADALGKNTTLSYLNLWDNPIGSRGTTRLAAALRRNATLTSISLGPHGNVDFSGALELAKSIQKNKTLRELSVTGLCEDGEKALVRALGNNTTLKSFSGFDLAPYAVALWGLELAEETDNQTLMRQQRIAKQLREYRWLDRDAALQVSAMPGNEDPDSFNLMYWLPSKVLTVIIEFL